MSNLQFQQYRRKLIDIMNPSLNWEDLKVPMVQRATNSSILHLYTEFLLHSKLYTRAFINPAEHIFQPRNLLIENT